jgi:hypothetical protein
MCEEFLFRVHKSFTRKCVAVVMMSVLSSTTSRRSVLGSKGKAKMYILHLILVSGARVRV